MHSFRRGNQSWEVQRLQQNHRDKMGSMTSRTNYRPTQRQHQQHQRRGTGIRRASARAQLAEIDVKRKNVFLVEKMVHIHRIGGFQRRFLHEFQDCKAALQFGKTNVGVSRAVHEHRRKKQELLRSENARLFTRLASPARSGIDFKKFEADFAQSRKYHQLAQCDRTVGYTSVYSSPVKADCPAGNPTIARQKEHQPTDGRRLIRQRPASAGRGSDTPPTPCGSNNLKRNDGTEAHHDVHVGVNRESTDATSSVAPSRPHKSGRDGCRSTPDRPQTALGLRRSSNHGDLFDARAADPGWGSVGASAARCRPPSAPERMEWGRWSADIGHSTARRRGDPPSFRNLSGGKGCIVGGTRRSRRPAARAHRGRRTFFVRKSRDDEEGTPAASTEGGGPAGLQGYKSGGGRGGEEPYFLGQTLLAEANVVIFGVDTTATERKKNDARGRTRTQVALRLSSLDGLVRESDGVRKTLRGFVVEAVPLTEEGKHPARSCGGRTGSTAFAVPTVQEYLENKTGPATGGDELKLPSAALAPFREAHPLDDRGNYPEINALLGPSGRRGLFQALLGSCRVVVPGDPGGKIGVQPLRIEGGDGLSVSFTDAASQRISARPRPPSRTC
ncbi:unnamed protein product [Hapterophycus canaliculatus]